MTRLARCIGIATISAVGFTVAPAAGDIIIGNFSGTPGTSTAFGAGSTTQFKAFGFTMGSDAYTLDDVLLTLVVDPGANPVVSIWSGASAPETELAVLDNPDDMLGSDDYAFTPSSQFVFEANETYWLHVRSEPLLGPAFLWTATDPSTPPTGIAQGEGYIFNGNPSTFRNRLQINGTIVPAPAAFALLSFGFAAGNRRRRAA